MSKTIDSYSPLVKYIAEIRSYSLKLKRKGLPAMPPPGKPRDVVKTLSVASGGRLYDNLTSVDHDHGLPLFVTLTYPNDFPCDWSIWKRHLHNFRRTLFRDFARSLTMDRNPTRLTRAGVSGREPAPIFVGGIWRLEAQRRGAPHYHILLWTHQPFTAADLDQFRAWIAQRWYMVVGSGDEKHLRAGTSVEKVKDREGIYSAMGYLCKYLGKDSVHPDSQVYTNPVGRYWGVWGKKDLLKKPDEYELTGKAYAKVRRVLYKQKEVKAKRRKSSRIKGKCSFNRCAKRQLEMPGTKTFMDEKVSLKLLNVMDPPPF